MNAVVNFNGLDLEVLEFNDTWALSNKQVADGFGVSEEAIRQQKSRGEYRNNVHFYTVTNCNGGAYKTFWTKKGVITLGFKLRETPQTIAFRDWASDFILKSSDIISKSNPYLDKLVDNMGVLNEKIDKLQAKNSALAGELIEASRKYTAALERENALLRRDAEGAGQLLKKSTKLSEAERDEVARLYESGLSQAQICRRLGRSDTAVRNAIRSRSLGSASGLFRGAL